MDEVTMMWRDSMNGRGLSLATVKRRCAALRQLAHWVQPLPVLCAEPVDIEAWLARQRSQWTRVAYFKDAKAFYSWAVRRGLLERSPVDAMDAPVGVHPLPRPLTPAELAKAFAYSAGDLRVMLMLGAYAGLRVSEIAGLHMNDVRLHGAPAVLIVRAGKGRRDRVVPLHPLLRDALSMRRGWVIQRADGGRYTPSTITVRIGDHLRALGIAATAHALRHSFGTECARVSHGNLVAVSRLLGHSNPSTSMGYIGMLGDYSEVVDGLYAS
jgi:integrase